MNRTIFPVVFLFVSCSLSAMESTVDAKLERMKYNHPGLVVDLGVGLWAWPLPMDFNGDGHTDLLVCSSDKPYNGVYLFEHPGTNEKMPVFKKARRISRGQWNAQVAYLDGKPWVTTPACDYPDFFNTGLELPERISIPFNPDPERIKGPMSREHTWKYVDWDGDGRADMVICYTKSLLYVARNRGTNEKPEYAEPELVFTVKREGEEERFYGIRCPSFVDMDGDGDLDMIAGDNLDGFYYFENTGTRSKPEYGKKVKLALEDGSPLAMDVEMVTPVAFDWTGNGFYDLICGDEDGRVALIENTGTFKDGMPVFLAPKYFRQEANELKCGALATPCAFDWDGDGDWDIISGNTAGYIMFYENLSGPGVERPRWAEPKYLEVDGNPFRILAGLTGSVQGPGEAKWGYTTLTVGDWDGDELPDIVASSIWGKVFWLKNIGPRNRPKLAAPQPIEVEWNGSQPELSFGKLKPEGKALLTQWRTTPVVFDWNGDGLLDLSMLDHEGYFALFERKKEGDRLLLLPPQRVFRWEGGHAMRLNDKTAGASGRRKICVGDFDGDGRPDIIADSVNADLFRQTGTENDRWFFKNMGQLDGRMIKSHTTSPTLIDLNGDGLLDLLIGAEDGFFYYKRNPFSKN